MRPKLPRLSWPSWRPGWHRRARPPRPAREPANLHWLIVVAAAVPALAVAGFAGVQSYSHIEQLAIRAAEPMIDARLLPLSLDGIIVAGVVIILAGSWLGWLCVAPGVAGTLFANLAWGLPHGHLAATVATWPAVAFSVVSFVLERWLKSLLGRGGRGGHADPLEELLLTEDEPEVPAIDLPCPHGVALTVEDAIVSAYLHGRDCLHEPPSQRALAASFGVHRDKVARLVNPLAGSLNGQQPPEAAEAATATA
ncbi:MAG TPA: hypothetical protein VHZ03_45475 [Trebonia sp.]|nr:hypothetical protein [Trebonia sp.]